LSRSSVEAIAFHIFSGPTGYRLESRERHGSAALVLPAGKSTFLMGCISFGIFQSCHTVQVGCTTAVYQLVARQSKFKLLPHPNKAWSQCSGDSYVLYRRKIGERRLEIDF